MREGREVGWRRGVERDGAEKQQKWRKVTCRGVELSVLTCFQNLFMAPVGAAAATEIKR